MRSSPASHSSWFQVLDVVPRGSKYSNRLTATVCCTTLKVKSATVVETTVQYLFAGGTNYRVVNDNRISSKHKQRTVCTRYVVVKVFVVLTKDNKFVVVESDRKSMNAFVTGHAAPVLLNECPLSVVKSHACDKRLASVGCISFVWRSDFGGGWWQTEIKFQIPPIGDNIMHFFHVEGRSEEWSRYAPLACDSGSLPHLYSAVVPWSSGQNHDPSSETIVVDHGLCASNCKLHLPAVVIAVGEHHGFLFDHSMR